MLHPPSLPTPTLTEFIPITDNNPSSTGRTTFGESLEASQPLHEEVLNEPEVNIPSSPTLECPYSKIQFNYSDRLCHFTLYETYNRFYLVGCDSAKKRYKMLKIDKINTASLQGPVDICDYLNEDAGEYTVKQINDLLSMIKLAVKSIQNDLKLHTNNICGILGVIELKSHYYLILITDRRKVGSIGNASVYEIKDTKLVPLSSTNASKQDQIIEDKYKELFHNINLNQDFYFSYHYDLSKTLQQNSIPLVPDEPQDIEQYQSEMFVWNDYMLQPFKKGKLNMWMCPCIHGHFIQSKISMMLTNQQNTQPQQPPPSPIGRMRKNSTTSINHEPLPPKTGNSNISVVLTVIARRSRFYAGTRYLKRGISDGGNVANHVEIEQIVYESNYHLFNYQSQGSFSSFVQVRGSIPLYWSQSTATTTTMTTTTTTLDENDQKNTTTTTTKASTSNLLAKPNIIITKFDPLYVDSMKHFKSLIDRYDGSPIMCLDLVKQHEKKPRENILGEKFRICLDYLNKNSFGKTKKNNEKLEYIPFDFRYAIKDKPEKALNELHAIAENHLRKCKFFSTSRYGKVLQKQSGVLRTNCIDCLDRTGVAQFIIAKYVLGEQLCSLGVIESPHLVHHGQFILILMQMYEQVSDHIALQYSGSKTVSVDIHNRGGVLADLMTNMKRYYSSNFKDESKQHGINIFLGNFKPGFHTRFYGAHLWDLESGDIYLHQNGEQMQQITQEDESDEDEERYDDGYSLEEQFFDETYNPRKVTDLQLDESCEQLPLVINPDQPEEDTSNTNEKKERSKQKAIKKAKEGERLASSPNTIEDISPSPNSNILKTIISTMKFGGGEGGKEETAILTQGEILRSFEGKMSNDYPNISHEVLRDFYSIDVDNIYNNVSNTKYIERNFISGHDLYIYSNYSTEFNDKIIEERNMSFISTCRADEYQQYISSHFKERSNEVFNDPPPSNIKVSQPNTIYSQYVKYQHDVTFLNRKDVSKNTIYQQLVSTAEKKKHNSIDGALSDLSSNNMLYRDDVYVINRLKNLFPYSQTVSQLVTQIQTVITFLKNNLTLLDRVRYPKQTNYSTSLYNLLKGKIYRKCFESKEAIDTLLAFNQTYHASNEDGPFMLINIKNRNQAVEFYQILLECNIIHHVNYGQSFIDGYYLYRFSNDNPIRIINMSLNLDDLFTSGIENISVKYEPNTVLFKLMEYLRQIYQGMFPKHGKYNYRNNTFFKTIAINSRKIICSSPIYLTQVLPACHELARIDLSSLIDLYEEKNERIRFKSFFLNLFLALFYHSLLVMGASSKYRIVGNNATFIFYNRMAYQVDGLIFSLSDIRDGILRGNKNYPNGLVSDSQEQPSNTPIHTSGRILSPPLNTCQSKSFDRRSRILSFYAKNIDLRLIFVIHRYAELLWSEKSQVSILPNAQQFKNMRIRNCCNLLPYITPDSYESFVRMETEIFLLQHIKIINTQQPKGGSSTVDNLVVLPKLFRIYREDFGYTLQDITLNLLEKCMSHESTNEQHGKAFNLLKDQIRHVHKHANLYTVKEEEM